MKKTSTNGRDDFHKDVKMSSLEGYWDYLVNCSQSLILDHGYWTSESETDLKDVLMVRLSSLLLKSLDQIGSCRGLRICILADNFLTKIEAVMECTRLVKLNLKGNQVFIYFICCPEYLIHFKENKSLIVIFLLRLFSSLMLHVGVI